MNRLFSFCAAVAVTAFIALPGSAGAGDKRPEGMHNSNTIEVSSIRRHRRYGYSRRYYARPYYAPQPYYGYGYQRGPSWGPAPFPFIFGLPY